MTTKKDNIIKFLLYLYIILPIIIFIIGWCKLSVAIISSLIILFSTYHAYKNDTLTFWTPNSKKEHFLWIMVIITTFIWVCSSGIGALAYQNFDHNCRNPIFEILVNQPWPVESADGKGVLTYYIGFWLFPAIIGKLFNNVQIGYYAQILWASIGIILFFNLVLNSMKNKKYWAILLFIFFSGMDILGVLTIYPNHKIEFITHIEHWYPGFQFSSITTQLYWVFNQAIPAWLVTLILYKQKNNKNILFFYSCMFINSTLPAIGILPIMIYWGLKNGTEDNKILSLTNLKKAFKTGLTVQNTIGCLIITAISYLYLSNNISGGETEIIKYNFITFYGFFIYFFMFEVGSYLILIASVNKKNFLFYLITILFLIYPFIQVGHSIDFCMRATIPLLILLYLFIVEAFENIEFKKKKSFLFLLIFFLLIGAINPLREITRTVYYTSKGIKKQENNLGFDNFFAWKKDNTFLKYIGKPIK